MRSTRSSAIIRDRLVHGIGYREILGYLSNAYLIDLCLAPVGLAFAIAVVARPAGILLLFPLLFLMQSFARERMARIDQALELGSAYAGTGRLAEMYHELLAAESLDATLERISNALSDLIAGDGMQIVERKGAEERTLLARGRLDGERRFERSAQTEDDAESATSLTLTVFPASGRLARQEPVAARRLVRRRSRGRARRSPAQGAADPPGANRLADRTDQPWNLPGATAVRASRSAARRRSN